VITSLRPTRTLTAIAVSFLVLVAACNSGDRNRIDASGTIEATEVTVSAKVGGEIIAINVKEGSAVRAGDTLAVLDHSSADIELRQAEANANAASAQYRLTVRGARREDLLQAEATFNNAQADLQRMETLFSAGTATQKQLDDARTRFVVAEQTYEKLKSGSRSEEIEAARARRDQAAAQADVIRKRIRDASIVSPIAGTITLKVHELGETVVANAAMFRITELDRVRLMIYVPEADLARIKLGERGEIRIDGMPDKSFPGTITYISPVAEFTPRNIQTREERTKLVFGVKIEADNPDHVLKPGMPADVVVAAAGG
jgi:HlyD family secretion protein